MADVKQDDYTLEKSTDDLLSEDSLPYYFEKIKLSNDDKKRLEKECMAELKEIKAGDAVIDSRDAPTPRRASEPASPPRAHTLLQHCTRGELLPCKRLRLRTRRSCVPLRRACCCAVRHEQALRQLRAQPCLQRARPWRAAPSAPATVRATCQGTCALRCADSPLPRCPMQPPRRPRAA